MFGGLLLTTILTVDEPGDTSFSQALSELLSRHFVIASAYGQKLTASGQTPALLLCDNQSFQGIEADQVIVVYQAPGPIIPRIESALPTLAIVDSSQDDLLEYVSKTRLPAITCGLKSRDTITLSSMAAPGAVIDLRRGIDCLDGNRVDPQELPIRLDAPLDSFLLMSAAAILILSGKIHRLKEGFI